MDMIKRPGSNDHLEGSLDATNINPSSSVLATDGSTAHTSNPGGSTVPTSDLSGWQAKSYRHGRGRGERAYSSQEELTKHPRSRLQESKLREQSQQQQQCTAADGLIFALSDQVPGSGSTPGPGGEILPYISTSSCPALNHDQESTSTVVSSSQSDQKPISSIRLSFSRDRILLQPNTSPEKPPSNHHLFQQSSSRGGVGSLRSSEELSQVRMWEV